MNLLSLKFSIGSHFAKMKAEKKIQPEKKKSRFQSARFKV